MHKKSHIKKSVNPPESHEETGSNDDEIVALLQELISVTRAGHVMKVDKRVLARTAADGINDLTTQAGKPVLLF